MFPLFLDFGLSSPAWLLYTFSDVHESLLHRASHLKIYEHTPCPMPRQQTSLKRFFQLREGRINKELEISYRYATLILPSTLLFCALHLPIRNDHGPRFFLPFLNRTYLLRIRSTVNPAKDLNNFAEWNIPLLADSYAAFWPVPY